LAARKVCRLPPKLVVRSTEEKDIFDISLELTRSRFGNGIIEVIAWPISQQISRALPLIKQTVFARLSFAGLTPLRLQGGRSVGGTKAEAILS